MNDEKDLGFRLLMGAFNSVIEDFINNQDSIFRNDKERLSVFYPIHESKMREWKMSRRCIYRDCANESIKRSHTITQNIFLTEIAENGHVYTPRMDMWGKTVIKKMGINEASTFPGFCKQHEKLFHDFESKKKIEDANDAYRQMYRTACREIVIRTHRLSILEEMKKKYTSFRDNKLFDKIKKKPIIKLMESSLNFEMKDFKLNSKDIMVNIINEYIQYEKSEVENIQQNFLNRMHDELEGEQIESSFGIVAIGSDVQVPIALSGKASFWIEKKDEIEKTKVDFLVSVLPTNNSTTIFFLLPQKTENYIYPYLGVFLEKDLGFLKLIETLMIHGPDHWFIKPTVWEQITIQNKEKILESIINEKDITKPFELSIFNKIRRDCFQRVKNNKTDAELDKLIQTESSKFSDIE